MHRALILSFGLVLASPMTALGQTRPASQGPTDLILAVDARRTSASGTSSAGDHGDTTFESYTYSPTSDLCGLGTGNSEPERMPWVGWHFKADVLGSSVGAAGPELNVRIAWERRWENGARTSSGPRGTNTVTMRGGDVLVLDRVTGMEGRCGGELRLEASVMSASARTRNMRGAFGAGRGGRGGAMAGGGVGTGVGGAVAGATQTGVAGGRGSGRGGGGGTGVAGGGAAGTGTQTGASAGRGSTTMTGGRGAGRGAGGGAVAAGSGTTQSGSTTTRPTTGATRGGGAGATAGTGQTTVSGRGGRGGGASTNARQLYEMLSDRANTHTAEVWLIHRTPDNVEHVQQQTIQFGRANRDFSFPPVAVNTPRGVVMVDINGSLRIAESRITIGLSRRARSSSLQPALDTTGSSEMTFDMPKPEDVLSFEFPALQRPAEDLLAKHRFSVRVRLR